MILVHFKVLMLSQIEEPHRIFDHDAQPARTDHQTQTGQTLTPTADAGSRCAARVARATRGAHELSTIESTARELQDDVRNFLGRARIETRELPAC